MEATEDMEDILTVLRESAHYRKASLNQPDLMEPTLENREYIITFMIGEGNTEFLEKILRTRTVRLHCQSVMGSRYESIDLCGPQGL